MHSVVRTDSSDPGFVRLVGMLDEYLAIQDGKDHAFYHTFNQIHALAHVVVAISNNLAVGCGAIKALGQDTMEIKRMFTDVEHRKRGIAADVVSELELWAKELGASRTVLETGKKQMEAIALYTKQGYRQIPNYGQYVGIENSICFEKQLN